MLPRRRGCPCRFGSASSGRAVYGDPGLIVDELLGMTIANYIAGARGIFEFIRYDQAKPGILRKLGPIANDAVGGHIAGVSSRIYSGTLELGPKNR